MFGCKLDELDDCWVRSCRVLGLTVAAGEWAARLGTRSGGKAAGSWSGGRLVGSGAGSKGVGSTGSGPSPVISLERSFPRRRAHWVHSLLTGMRIGIDEMGCWLLSGQLNEVGALLVVL